MKKEMVFEFEEKVTYNHKVKVEIEEEQEDAFEEYADIVAQKIEDAPESYDRYDVAGKFRKMFGDKNVTFCEDGSPEGEYEAG